MKQYEGLARIKKEIAILIKDHLLKNAISQTRAAKISGTEQPRISNIVNLKIEQSSLEYILNLALVLGVEKSRIKETI